MRSSNNDVWIIVGRIRAPHGVRGELAVEVLTDFPQRFSPGNTLYLENPGGEPIPMRLEASRRYKHFWIVRLERITTRTEAERFRRRELLIPKRALKKLPPNNYYIFDLIGCQVLNISGSEIGTVTNVLETSGGALLQVKSSRREVLIPMVEGIVRIDADARVIFVNPPEGLLKVNL